MKLIKFAAAAGLLFGCTVATAAPIAGFSDVTQNGDLLTFTFDTLPGPDIDGNAEGLSFSGFGVDLTVTGSSTVRQDVPANGGLGILGSTNGDNFDSLTETMSLAFNQMIDLVAITFNGLMSSDGHTDAADGWLGVNGNVSPSTWAFDASFFDGVTNGNTGMLGAFTANDFVGINLLTLDKAFNAPPQANFHGYLESLTIRVSRAPEPSILALFGLGILGLGLIRRRRA